MAEKANEDRLQPVPELAAWYAVQHQQKQEAIGDKVISGLTLLWPYLAFNNLIGTTDSWLHASLLQVQAGFSESSAAAGEFVQASLWSVEPDAPPMPDVKVEFPAQDIARKLNSAGPAKIKKLSPGPEQDIMDRAFKAVEGVARPEALGGARDRVQAQVLQMAPERKSRRKAIGWARVTDDKPCYFCAMLASRGAFYLSGDSFKASNKRFEGDGTAKVHDHCQCTLRAVFSLADGLDDRAKYFFNMWKDAQNTRKSDETAIQAYRRFYIPPPPYKLGEVLSLDERRNAIEVARRNRDILLFNRGLREDSPQIAFWERTMSLLEQG